MQPTIGRIVLYRLTETDVVLINKVGQSSQVQHNPVYEGQVYPATVVAVFGNGEHANLKVFLDGGPGAEYWATSRPEGDTPGTWCWPPRV